MMEMLIFSGTELFWTYLRNFIAIYMIACMTGTKEEREKYCKRSWILAALMTFIGIVMGNLGVYPGCILAITVLFSACLAGYASSGGLLLRITASALAFFLMAAVSLFIGTGMLLLFQIPEGAGYDWMALEEPGAFCLYYRLLSIAASFLLYEGLKNDYSHLKLLGKIRQSVILLLLTVSYTILEVLKMMLNSDSILSMQRAVMLCGMLVLLLVFLSPLLNIWIARHHHAVSERGLWNYTNGLMETNYRQLFANQQLIAKQVHDFNNHLYTIQGLMNDGDLAAKEYISELLETSLRQAAFCQSGSEVIDAIINCKQAEAQRLCIRFTYVIHLPPSLSINSIDLCTVLANLLDNAVEACQKLTNPKDRFIHVSIGQKYNFIFFKVENSVDSNPLGEHRSPVTTKKDGGRPHGLGLKNVLETVRRYNGALEHVCKDYRFSTVAMMQLPAEDIRKLQASSHFEKELPWND